MSDSELQDPPRTPDPDDADAIGMVKPALGNPVQPAPPVAAEKPTAQQNFSDFLKNGKPQKNFSVFMQEKPPGLLENVAIGMLPRQLSTIAGIATGHEMTPIQRTVLANQQFGHILDAMGKNFNDYMGDNVNNSEVFKEGMEPTDFKNYLHKQDIIDKGWYDGLVMPAVKTFASLIESDAAHIAAPFKLAGVPLYHTPGALFASYFGAGGPTDTPGAVEQSFIESGMPNVGREVAQIPMALAGEGFAGHPFSGFRDNARDVAIRRNLVEPTTSNVIGRGITEENYFGTKGLTDEQQVNADRAAATLPPEVPPPTVHEVARQMAPDVFGPYDQLARERDLYRGMLNTMREAHQTELADLAGKAPQNEQIAALQDKAEGASARNAKRYQDEMADLIDRKNEWIESQRRGDTPEMAVLRANIIKNDEAMRDIAHTGKMAEMLRKAQELMPEPTRPEVVEPPVVEAPKGISTRPVSDADLKGMTRQPSTENNPEIRIAHIVNDVAKKMLSAGRPEDEANAAAQLVAAHYEAVAEQGWAKGSSLDIYRRHMAEIEEGKSRAKPVRVMAQESGRTLAQKFKGRLRIAMDDARNTIVLMKNADASTFIHEVGHHWLEEMMRFAAEEDAPESLKAHADTVRSYLNFREGEDIPTRSHEKFARSFERYMMEGIAPNKNLAGVFAQFKTWLNAIYRTVDRLKAPITPDIRNVFDHLLSAKPERTVIARDTEPSASLAVIHEHDAAATPPEKAHAAADNIEKEIDLTAHQHKPEIADVIKTAEDGKVAEPIAQPAGLVAPPEIPVAGGPGGITEPAAVPAGGGGVEAEGGTESGRQAGAGSGSAERERSDAAEERDNFVDNINLDKLVASDGLEQMMREASEKNGGYMAQRQKLTVGQMIDMADASGLDPFKIKRDNPFVQVLATKKLFVKAFEDTKKAAENVRRAAEGEDKNKALTEYARKLANFEYLQGKVAGNAADSGRALHAHRILVSESKMAMDLGAFLKENTGRDLYQLDKMVRYMENMDQGQVGNFIDNTAHGNMKNAILYYYINALLSGPFTHMRYLVGNELKMAVMTPAETFVAASIGAAREMVTGKTGTDRVYFREIPAQLVALWDGHRDGYYAATKAFASGVSDPLPGEQFRSNTIVSNIPVLGTGEGFANRIIETYGLPQKSVAAIHSLNKTTAYTQQIYSMATRQAIREGLSGDAMASRITQLRLHPTEEMQEIASQTALQRMYMSHSEYDSAMATLSRAVNQNLMAKLIIPFLKVGSEITREAFIQGSPLGLLSRNVRENIAAGGTRRDIQVARMAMGSGLMASGVMFTLSGRMTGDGPDGVKERAEWLLTHRPNSFLINGVWIPYQGLGSMGMGLRFAANMTETAHYIGHEDLAKVVHAGIEGISKSVLDENFMRGAKDFLDAMYHQEQYGDNYVTNFAANWIPWSVGLGQVARFVDPEMREAHGLVEAARKKIPWLSESLFPKVDRYGEVIPQDGSYERYKNDYTVHQLDSLGFAPSKVENKIRGVPLTEKQYFEFATLAGRRTKMALDNLMGQPSFTGLTPAQKFDRVSKMVKMAREQARGIMMMNYPEIIKQAHALKTAP